MQGKQIVNEKSFLALDIGSSKIVAVIGRVGDEEHSTTQIFGQGTSESNGLKKGIITNIQEASNSVAKAVEGASRIAGMNIEQATISISSAYTKGVVSHGIVNVIDGEISINEIKRSIDTALYNAQVVQNEYKVIHVLPYMFKVDEHDGIDDPIGMNGSRLEAFVYIVTAQKSALSNLEKVVKSSGIRVKNFVLDGYATSISVVNKDEKHFGVATINMGGSISNLTITQGNTICYNDVILIGSNNITKDISITAQTNIQSAEKVKLECVSLLSDKEDNESIELPMLGDTSRKHTISINIINQIAYARVEETLILLKKMLLESGFKDSIGAGVVITGGMAKIKGMQEIAKKIFDTFPVRIAKPNQDLMNTLHDERYSTISGLIMYASGRYTKYEIDSNKILRYSNQQAQNDKEEFKSDLTESSNQQEDIPTQNNNFLSHALKIEEEHEQQSSKFTNWIKDLF